MTGLVALAILVAFALGCAVAWAARSPCQAPEVSEGAYGKIRFKWQMEEDPMRRMAFREVLDIIEGGDDGDL